MASVGDTLVQAFSEVSRDSERLFWREQWPLPRLWPFRAIPKFKDYVGIPCSRGSPRGRNRKELDLVNGPRSACFPAERLWDWARGTPHCGHVSRSRYRLRSQEMFSSRCITSHLSIQFSIVLAFVTESRRSVCERLSVCVNGDSPFSWTLRRQKRNDFLTTVVYWKRHVRTKTKTESSQLYPLHA